MKYSRIIAEFYGQAWALREETLMAMQDLIRHQAAGTKWTPEEIRDRIADANAASGYLGHENLEARYLAFDDEPMPMLAKGKRNAAAPGSVALIPMTGIISHRMSMMSEISGGGGGSIQNLAAQFRQALGDGNCKAIVFDVDSPGGSVEGVMEFAQEIYDSRKLKPITAVFNAMGCSAAYWLASAASEVVCTPSGQCGSIGVFMLTQDMSEALKNEGIKINVIKFGKYKAEGHPSQPLSEEAQAFLQSQVDAVGAIFVKAVAQQRGTSQAAVRENFGQGRSLLASAAVKAGLADREGTLDSVLEKYGVKKASGSGSQASAAAASGSAAAIEAASIEATRLEKLKARTKPNPDDEPDQDDDTLCECKCDDCQSGNHAQCSDEMCEDPNCGHPARAALTTPALTAKEQAKEQEDREAAAAGDCLRAYQRRRRQLLLH
jgi:signal peptide peptidase SppA